MTRLGSEKTWMIALGFLALAAAGCPRQTFELGGIKDPMAGAAGGGAGAGGAAGSGSGGASCGSRGQAACDDDEFCSFPKSASCGDTDKPGVCTQKPEACDAIYKPVCGCDGKTYGNACEANSKSVSARSDGECKSNGQSCGGLIGKACPSGQYCDYPLDAICGAADATGTCKATPQVCRDIYQPVCGCDDKTYGNACEANSKSVSVASEGECGTSGAVSCGGLIGKACPSDEYCNYPTDAICGAADAPGTCAKKPTLCTEQYQPVCGCDGNTYGNACEAASKGMSVVSEGECVGPTGQTCGVRGAKPCADDQYCVFPTGSQCGAADEPGVCKAKPTACTGQFLEVCGCDGKTYGNECEAASGGAAVAHTGACESSGQAEGENCGGLAGLSCSAGQYCNYAQTASCGAADQFGKCTKQPTACTKEFHAVCGCDDKTYSNPCMAASAGISIASEGECSSGTGSGKVCGGLTGAGCPSGEYCNFPESAQCGAADQTGKCNTMPGACTLEYAPVCGCDDKTYGNACAAASAGVSVVHSGEC